MSDNPFDFVIGVSLLFLALSVGITLDAMEAAFIPGDFIAILLLTLVLSVQGYILIRGSDLSWFRERWQSIRRGVQK